MSMCARQSMRSSVAAVLLMMIVADAKPKQCCDGQPCGDSCISLKSRCSKGAGAAVCKRGAGCPCEFASSRGAPYKVTGEGWKAREYDVPDEPWLVKLHRCIDEGGAIIECSLAVFLQLFAPSDVREL